MSEYPRKWEIVDQDECEITSRLKVHGGWMIRVRFNNPYTRADVMHMHFFKDAEHLWELEKKK